MKSMFARLIKFEGEAHHLLGVHERSPSRVILLEDSYKKLKFLNLFQDELFRQSLRCIENELFRAAHVMAWAGFMDYLEEKICADGLKKLNAVRPKWAYKTVEDLREHISEFQIIEVTKDLGLCTKNEVKALQGLLNKRNECAHPSGYFPLLNETLGFFSELLNRVQGLSVKIL